MTKDYTSDYQDAYEAVLEEGTVGVLTWQSGVTTDQNSGVQSGGTTLVADVAVIVLPAGSRGDTYESQVQVRNTRRSFIAVPALQSTEIKNGQFLTVGGVKYEVEAASPLAPSGAVRILYQGFLRIAG